MEQVLKPGHSLGLAWLLAITMITLSFGANPFFPSHTNAAPAASPDLPSGFAKTLLAKQLNKPTALDFGPNGDIYIAEQPGAIVLYGNGKVSPTTVVTLKTDSSGEKGLLGLVLDPHFATNGYIYVSYTTADVHAQLSRLTVQNGTASLSTEKVLMKGDQMHNAFHSANDVHIGPDGKLWWSVGDNVPNSGNAQTPTNIYGKILRFNLDGTTPADNPFLHIPGAVPTIYAYGLRNPYRFTFLPNGKAMAADTGSSYWEELDTVQVGGNFGWNNYEGYCGSCGAINPTYAYGHLPVDGAISAIAAYSGSTFPKPYKNVVFIGDFVRQDIEAITFDPTYTTEISDTVFDKHAGTIADLQKGPDGNLYYLSIYEGTLTKISSTGSSQTSASNAIQTDAVSLQANVVSPNVNASITSPTATATFKGGDTISFSGTATDSKDGTLPAKAYTWQVDLYNNGVLQPFYTYEKLHPFYGPITGVTGGSFKVPQDLSINNSSLYRITLTVVNSSGDKTVVTRDIHPQFTKWSVKTNIPGAAYMVDGTWQTKPITTQDVVGIQHVLAGVPAQMIGGKLYRFAGWSNGGALTDTITNPTANTTYTANYDQVSATLPSSWKSADIGNPVLPGTANYSASDKTFYVDGSGADIHDKDNQFHSVYQSLQGDGTIIARVRYQTASNAWAKAGIMIKQSTTANSNYVDALVTPNVSPNTPNINGVGCTPDGCGSPLPPVTPSVGKGVHMQYNFTSDQAITSPNALAGYHSPNQWLKLQRTGNTFTSWYSTDGVTWTLIGKTTLTMQPNAIIGLFVCSQDVRQYSNVAFDHVGITTAA